MEEVFGLERLFDEVKGAAADRGDRGVDSAMPRNHDDRQRRIESLDRLDETEAIEPRTLEPDVDQRERRAALTDRLERSVAVGSGARLIAFVLHDRSEEHTSELQSLMRISYAVFCLQKKKKTQ